MDITVSDMVTFLGDVPGFKDLPMTDVEEKIIPIIGITQFSAGQNIINSGDSPHTLFIIFKGRVHGKTKTPDKQEHHFFIHEGNVFGESALVSNNRRSSQVTASSPTTCLTLDIDTFQHIMMRDWRFTKAFFILIGQRAIERLVKVEIETYYWSDKYRIGVNEVDDQHKRILESINELGKFLNSAKSGENIKWRIQTFIVEILNYTEKHFRDEEQLMEEAKAPWLEEHKQVHKGLANDVLNFRERISELSDEDEQLHILEQMHKFMVEWLIHHIMVEDAKFGQYYMKLAVQ
ncbi:MAG: bacteriohemerythrin [Magnetococcales bacterium]|nr:bacteriohemerythrin [Magnetococcales bacterium]